MGYDDDMRVKILEAWDDKTNMSLADLIVKVKRYETAKITGRQQSNKLNAVYTHRKNKMAPKHNNEKRIVVCRKCKTTGHYDQNCSNKNAKCTFCRMNNHTTDECKNKKIHEEQLKQQEKSIANASATPSSTTTSGANSIQSEKLFFHNINSINCNSPMISLIGQQLDVDNHDVFEVEALADTGADECIMDKNTWRSLPGRKARLRQCNMRLTGANGLDLQVVGETNFELKVKESPKNKIWTRVIVMKNLNKPFILSVGALKKLSIIPADFPSVINAVNAGDTTTMNKLMYKASDLADCGCLKRSVVPNQPVKPPYELKEENRKKLEQFILDYYAISVFNKCEHQQLPILSGEPMQILIDKTRPRPVPANKPSTVPQHWEIQVRNDVNRDVRLGVIEKVPENTPQTYCVRMHAVRKHNGNPRRVVDFTELNRISHRQPHTTVRPFPLAVRIPR